ncbi:LacI family DNA-binding transcriptional regulator [Opitutus terrae]|uniref:Transcriptional regulator, LacI family n=1 Tax=Opitutus terrae (strain DSM 11246 / JCM 15787 / PB90-1) TaxID=452637 RepID=B1ZP70_OPITP|nr:LacI family DNA-binding transcriptional regulator [Opitutus terrae]ACB77559.1 transcriptional regulator, LacI family [Opitutus terrae PB90-1]
MRLKATLDDVARTAGVHRSTVSLSLRDHPRIPVRTRERVKAVARELGYQIDPLVAALMQLRRSPRPHQAPALAFVRLGPPNATLAPGDIDYLPGAAARARECGFRLLRFDDRDAAARPLADEFSVRGIKGALIDSTAATGRAELLTGDGFSCLSIGPQVTPSLHHVAENHFDAVGEALQRAAERGYSRIGYVPAAPTAAWRAERALGAYTIHQLRQPAGARLPACPGSPATYSLFEPWFLAHAPAALLTDDPALVRDWLRQLGRRVPDDVGLVSVRAGGEADCSGFYPDPAITGAFAVDALLDLMRQHETGIPAVAYEILLGAAWREHDTLPLRAPAAVCPVASSSA